MGKSREYTRAARVEEVVRREVSDILRREIKDPKVGAVTITRVKVSDDLKNATIHFGVLDRTAQAEEVGQALERSAGYIHHLLVKRMTQKIVPRLVFRFDRNLDYSFHISRILHGIEIPPEGEPEPDDLSTVAPPAGGAKADDPEDPES
jgi:ribosome-binding factor A